MKKFNLNGKYLSISFYMLCVICIAIAFEKILGNLNPLTINIHNIYDSVVAILSPFIYGMFIAYMLNSFLKFIENKLIRRIPFFEQRPKAKRLISVTITFLTLISAFIWIFTYLIPEITDNIDRIGNLLLETVPQYMYIVVDPIEKYLSQITDFDSFMKDFNNFFSTNLSVNDIVKSVTTTTNEVIKSLTSTIPDLINGFLSMTLNIVLGVVIAFYALCEKESYAINAKKLIIVFFKKETAHKVIYFGQQANRIFEQFIVGKAVDSFIIASIFFFGGLILNLPFLPILTIIIGITNMIPYFGPMIGAVPVILLVLLNSLVSDVSPMQALWTGIFVIILQQLDGIIIGPKILGDSTGLKPIGVIFSIIVGGALFGILGMFLGVPFFALFKLLGGNYLQRKYKEKIQ